MIPGILNQESRTQTCEFSSVLAPGTFLFQKVHKEARHLGQDWPQPSYVIFDLEITFILISSSPGGHFFIFIYKRIPSSDFHFTHNARGGKGNRAVLKVLHPTLHLCMPDLEIMIISKEIHR